MTGDGTTVVDAGATLTISGGSNKGVDRRLRNLGTANYTGTDLRFGLASDVSGIIDNEVGGTFYVVGGRDLWFNFNIGHAFNNAGTFTRTG